jgi:hypothetical protein
MTRAAVAFFILILSFGAASAQSCSVPNTLTNGTNADATQVMANFNALANCINSLPTNQTVPRSYLAGLTLSTAGSSPNFGIAAGAAASSSNTAMMTLASPYAKTTGGWAVGSGGGALDSGAIANPSTWYKVFEIQRPDIGVVDICITVNVLASGCTIGGTIPAAYTLFRYIGSMKTDGLGNWTKFTQNGDEFLWSVPTTDANNFGITNVATNFTLTVPTGIRVNALLNALFTNTASVGAAVLFYPLDAPQSLGVPAGNVMMNCLVVGQFSSSQVNLRTDTSARIGGIAQAASNNGVYLVTFGWIDRRGRDA